MRVIGGKYKGKRFVPPKNFPSRPTTDFAKEALFNILENNFDFAELRVLDLFAGTGSISLEFLSRGAGHVQSVEIHPVSFKFLAKMKTELNDPNWTITRADVFDFLQSTQHKFDLIFADPPFDLPNQNRIAELIHDRGLVAENGMLILEHGRENTFELQPHFTKNRNYGGVQFSFFEY